MILDDHRIVTYNAVHIQPAPTNGRYLPGVLQNNLGAFNHEISIVPTFSRGKDATQFTTCTSLTGRCFRSESGWRNYTLMYPGYFVLTS